MNPMNNAHCSQVVIGFVCIAPDRHSWADIGIRGGTTDNKRLVVWSENVEAVNMVEQKARARDMTN